MNVYISADIEGISGIANFNQTIASGSDYERARKLMTDEVNAAVRGAKAAGAASILVNDSHGSMTNLLIEEMDEDVKLITGNQKMLGMMEGINETFDAVFFIGYHARHNTRGVLSHSYDSRIISGIRINSVPAGEFEFNSMIAGHYNVPVALVCGDDVLAQQVHSFNRDIETAVVKRAVGRYCAECIQPRRVCKIIEEKAFGVLNSKLGIISPCKAQEPVELEVEFMDSAMGQMAAFIPGVELTAPNAATFRAKDIIEAYRVRFAMTALAESML